MTYTSPGERRRLQMQQRQAELERQNREAVSGETKMQNMISRLINGEGQKGKPVEVAHKVPWIVGFILESKDENVLKRPLNVSGYEGMPWSAMRISHVTEGWELSHVRTSKTISDSRYPDGYSGGEPLPGILTVEGDVYLNFNRLENIDGYVVYSGLRRVLPAQKLQGNRDLMRELGLLVRGR